VETDQVLEQLRQFVAERDWKQFHTPENLAKSISIEAAELLELFQCVSVRTKIQDNLRILESSGSISA
jgi:NTP pyrophosphatase (non-canonical NTP hydrolase)